MGFGSNSPEAIATAAALTDNQTISNTGQTNPSSVAGDAYSAVAGGFTFQTDDGGYWEAVAAGGAAKYADRTFATQQLSFDLVFDGFRPTGGDCRILQGLSADGTILKVEVTTAGVLKVYDLDNVQLWTASPPTIPTTGTWWRLAGVLDPNGNDLSDLTIDYYATATSDTPTATYHLATANLGSADITTLRRGKINTTPGATVRWRRDQWHDAMLGDLGRFSGPVAVSGDPADKVVADFTSLATSVKTFTMAAAQTSGTSIGTITVTGLVATFARPTVDTARIRFTFTDQVGRQTTRDVDYDVDTAPLAAGGGEAVWNGTAFE